MPAVSVSRINKYPLFIRLLYVLLMTAFLCPHTTQGQGYNRQKNKQMMLNDSEYTDRNNIFAVYPVPLIFGTYKLAYECRVAPHYSLRFIGSFTSAQQYAFSADSGRIADFTEGGLEIQFRRYLHRHSPSLGGLYICPYLQSFFAHYTFVYDPRADNSPRITGNAFSVGGGYIVGYQAVYRHFIVADVGIGGGFNMPLGNKTGLLRENLIGYTVYEKAMSPHYHIAIAFLF